MADVKRRANLLPDDITPRERAHADVDARLDEIDIGLPARAKSPADAPEAYLKYQAWERSVDVYDPAWPEAVRRDVIAAAPIVHRYKGTRYAVAAALAALRVDATITEWWQESPRAAPYTFRVTAYARARLYEGPILDARLIRAVYGAILAAKPESRAFSLAVGVAWTCRLGLAPALAVKARLARAVTPRALNDMDAALGLAPALAVKARLARAVVPRTETAAASALGLAPAIAAKVRLSRAVVFVLPE